MSGLTVLASKQPIVSTYGADALREGAADVRAAYDWHGATFVQQPSLAEVRRGFVEAILAWRTPKGCLVAPFGYGETASAIGLWRASAGGGTARHPAHVVRLVSRHRRCARLADIRAP
jgi:hypothetical protein